ncbi:DUF5673 domain-containing protein [Acidaminobacterium chupaoyuni]
MQFDIDTLLVFGMGIFDLWLIFRFFANRKEIEVRGVVPSRLLAVILISALFIWQTWQGNFTRFRLVFCALILFAVVMIWATPCGLSKKGVLSGIFPTPWEKLYYYDFEPYSEGKVRLRAHLSTTERNLIFPEDQRAKAEAFLVAGKVLSFAQYKELKRQRDSKNSN